MATARRRGESFVGIHFDFHAQDDPSVPVGARTTHEAVRRVVEIVEPDFIQFDCKGHPGLSSYPTRVGNPAPNIVGDPLAVIREVTNEFGVALYVHYSGLWDTYAMKLHPEWAVVNADGSKDSNIASVHSEYVDDLLIPQLLEVARDYGVNGAWVDGDTWAAKMDYSDAAAKAFSKEYGYQEPPRDYGDAAWDDWRLFCREAYKSYLRHYVDAIHVAAPQFEIGVNWAFAENMPEPVSANVDFLSGDANGRAGCYVRNEARCVASQGIAWDIMSWGFSGTWPDPGTNTTKSAVQLKQEAATVLALGGAYEAVFNQKNDGTIIQWNLPIMGEVARWCRDRGPSCFQSELSSDVAVLYSAEDLYWKTRDSEQLFRPGDQLASLRGIVDLLAETQWTVEVVMEAELLAGMGRFKAIVLPQTARLGTGTVQGLVEFAREGGALVLTGGSSIELFGSALGVSGTHLGGPDDTFHVGFADGLWGVTGTHFRLDGGVGGDELFGAFYPKNDFVDKGPAAAAVKRCGEGGVAFVCFDVGAHYYGAETSRCRRFFGALMDSVVPAPTVKVAGSSLVEVVFARRGGARFLHLINTAGRQKDPRVWVYDEIPTVGPLDCRVRVEGAVEHVTLEPTGEELAFRVADGTANFTVPTVGIYEIVRIE